MANERENGLGTRHGTRTRQNEAITKLRGQSRARGPRTVGGQQQFQVAKNRKL